MNAPRKTIESLKNFRDTLAHGKPLEIRTDVEVEATEEELRGRGYLSAPWEASVTGEFVEIGFEDMEVVWREQAACFKPEGRGDMTMITSDAIAIGIRHAVARGRCKRRFNGRFIQFSRQWMCPTLGVKLHTERYAS